MINILVTVENGSTHKMWMPIDTKLSDCLTLPEGIVSIEIFSVEY